MRIDTSIKDFSAEVKNRTLVVSYGKLFKVMSSAVLNGGLKEARSIINCHVPANYDHKNPEELLRLRAEALNIPGPVVGLLTAVDLKNLATSTSVVSKRRLLTIATAGLSNAARPGEAMSEERVGTINLIIIYEGDMTEGCMVNAIMTATESKCATLEELDVRTRTTKMKATGTSTDTVTICCLGKGETLRYAGSGTAIGRVLGKTVQISIRDSLRKQEGLLPGRSMTSRMEERGISFEEIVETAMQLFVPHPGIERKRDARRILGIELEDALSDINICCLISAGMRLEEDGKLGLIPKMSSEEFLKDPIYLLADEMIGRQIAEYIAGTKASFEFERFDREKPALLQKLGPFMDDVIAGLAAGISSKMYSTGLKERQD